jgi:hypothetical protein
MSQYITVGPFVLASDQTPLKKTRSAAHDLRPQLHPAWLGRRAQLPKTGFAYHSGKIAGRYRWACAHTEVAAGMGIDRDDRLYPDLVAATKLDHRRRDGQHKAA